MGAPLHALSLCSALHPSSSVLHSTEGALVLVSTLLKGLREQHGNMVFCSASWG